MTVRRRRRALWVLPPLLLLGIGGATLLVLRPGDCEDRSLPDGDVADAGQAARAQAPVALPGPGGDDREAGAPNSPRAVSPGESPAPEIAHVLRLPPEPPEVRELRRRPPPDPLEVAEKDFVGPRVLRGTRGVGGRIGGPAPVTGRVVDDVTGAGVRGAEVIGVSVQPDGTVLRRGGGGTTDEDGAFRLRPFGSKGDARFEVRVRHMRYASRVVPDWRDGDIALTPSERTTGGLEGTFRATHDGGVEGLLVLSMRERPLEKQSVFVWADTNGAFRVEGLAAGEYQVWSGSGVATAARVVAGGSSRIVVETSIRTVPATDDRRDVIVQVDHPLVRTGDAVRAFAGDALHWLTALEGGEARLRLPAGEWRVDVLLPDGSHLTRQIEVPRGSGPLTVALAGR